MITVEDPLTGDHRKRIAEFTARQQLPSLHGIREFVAAGGLISYGPTKFEMVINLKTAKALGLELPASVLARADELI